MRLAQKMQHYSTMRIHMKRVQYALEEEKRNSFYRELMVYLLFLAIMMMTVCTLPIQIPFEHNDALSDLYLDQEFHNVSFKKNIYEVNSIDEMWQWFDDVLLEVYYDSPQLNSRRISSIQVRTARMKGITCTQIDPTNSLALFPEDVCYKAFEDDDEDTTPYGDTGFGVPFTYENDLSFLVRSLRFTPSIINTRMDYGRGGYTVYLPRDNATAGTALVDVLKDSLVLKSTRGRNCFIDLGYIGNLVQDINNVSACVSLVSVAIVFKYLRLNTRLNMLWTTLRLAAKDLIAFVVIFIFIFFGYAVMGFLLFGNHVREYRSLSGSLASCFQMLLGAFDFDALASANPVMSGMFFFSFMIFVFLIVVNMFIAILSEYYSIAQEAKRKEDETKKHLLDDRIEYDVLNQVTKYVKDLRWRVKLSQKQPLPLQGGACVLLVDYSYLMAERARLRAKFRTTVRVMRICIAFLKPLRKFFSDFDAAHVVTSSLLSRTKLTIRTKSSRHMDYHKFPVTYVPLHSKAAMPLTMIEQLKEGDQIELDDGSLTYDRICLQVMGPQEKYLEGMTPTRPFGLHHVHPDIGSGAHIKCCRVIYQGEIIVAGNETCIVTPWIWFKYFGSSIVKTLARLFTRRFWRSSRDGPKTKNHQISDDDISQLLSAQLVSHGGDSTDTRGQSCRFDELVRQFRLFLAKKMHQGAIRIPNNDLEMCVKHEAIAFVERFSKAVFPLDKRELVGHKYVPAPTDTTHVRLPNAVSRLSEFLAHNAHEVWSQSRINQGWKWGPHRDNELKLHPDLIAYDQLTEEAKQYDRDTSMEALKVIQALGYVMQPKHTSGGAISKSMTSSSMDFDIDFGQAVPEGETYEPKPIVTDDVELAPELNSLVELLAENTHDVWAKKRMEEGWVYGPKRNDAKKEHDGLVPYVYLTPDEKDMDRNTAMQTIKCILRCGFTLKHKESYDASAKPKFKMFGRSEDVNTTRLEDATTVIKNVHKAKAAFLNRRTHKTYGSVAFADATVKTPQPQRSASVDMTQSTFPLTPLAEAVAAPPLSPAATTTTTSTTTTSTTNTTEEPDVKIQIEP
ncbi:unnamed protein product [Aphanomyces euteiches]